MCHNWDETGNTMSMICNLRQVEEAEIEELLANPEHIGDFLYGDVDDEHEYEDIEREGEIDLDKAWHGIHFLLTGTAWEGQEPLCYLLVGGEYIGDEDVGYGPARVLRPHEVADF